MQLISEIIEIILHSLWHKEWAIDMANLSMIKANQKSLQKSVQSTSLLRRDMARLEEIDVGFPNVQACKKPTPSCSIQELRSLRIRIQCHVEDSDLKLVSLIILI
ncbi:hypothetical protein VNO77_03721 [Canavalia gladiata]|uniref:Uncharacterized protein n=1 Tax=Canavalia gladiata TaxID=3824 RepID=A0AAN9MV90_CANGL